MRRREFLKGSMAAGATAIGAAPAEARRLRQDRSAGPAFEISLAGWSLNRRHFREDALPMERFPEVAREEFGIGAIELVNTMFPSPHFSFLTKLNARAKDHGVRILLVMVDGEGDLSSPNLEARRQAVRNHHKWIDVANVLGCHAIRVNTGGAPDDEATIERCADSLRRLAAYGMDLGVDIVCENHGGMSSHPPSMVRLMQAADSSHVGTLPDFGNFPGSVDRYEGIAAMMPWAKAVSAKCYDFGEDGRETRIDFHRMMKIVLDAGYTGHVGIEFEGGRMSEHDGILAARKLLEEIAGA